VRVCRSIFGSVCVFVARSVKFSLLPQHVAAKDRAPDSSVMRRILFISKPYRDILTGYS
jgi:hypothetical protein